MIGLLRFITLISFRDSTQILINIVPSVPVAFRIFGLIDQSTRKWNNTVIVSYGTYGNF